MDPLIEEKVLQFEKENVLPLIPISDRVSHFAIRKNGEPKYVVWLPAPLASWFITVLSPTDLVNPISLVANQEKFIDYMRYLNLYNAENVAYLFLDREEKNFLGVLLNDSFIPTEELYQMYIVKYQSETNREVTETMISTIQEWSANPAWIHVVSINRFI